MLPPKITQHSSKCFNEVALACPNAKMTSQDKVEMLTEINCCISRIIIN